MPEFDEHNSRRKLLELQQFVLSRRSEDIRSDLYEHMVMYVLYNHSSQDEYFGEEKISKLIEKEYHIKEIPHLHLNLAIQSLTSNGHVLTKDQKHALSLLKRNELKTNLANSLLIEQKVKDLLKLKLTAAIPSLSNEQIDVILSNFSHLLASLFTNYGSVVARTLAGNLVNMKEIPHYPAFQETYEKKIKPIVQPQYHNELDRVFNDFFANPNEEQSKFFFSLSQSYVYMQILNLDPDLQEIQKIAWAKKIIYLDTNVLIRLLFENDPLHKTILNIIKNTKRLGARLLVTEKTKEEFKKVLENDKINHKNFKLRSKFTFLLKETKRDNPFLMTYVNELEKNPNLPIDTFSKKYDHFDKLIESNYSIELEEYFPAVEDVDYLPNLRVHIVTRAPWKHPEVVYHDAYHILRVHGLRKRGTDDEIGPRSWLLTTDYTLQKAEKDQFGEDKIPASVTIDLWLQLISPFISPKLDTKDTNLSFSTILSSNFQSHKIGTNELNTFMAFMDDSKFTTEHLKIIIGNDFVKEKIHDLQDLIDKGEQITFEQFRPLFTKSIEIIESEYTKKNTEISEQHKKELEELQNWFDKKNKQEIESLEESLNRKHKQDLENLETKMTQKHNDAMIHLETNLRQEVDKVKQDGIKEINFHKLNITKWKIRLVVIGCSAIVTFAIIQSLFLFSKLQFYEIILVLIGLLGSEAGSLYLSTKLLDYRFKKKDLKKEPWNRQEKLTLIGVILTIIALIAGILFKN